MDQSQFADITEIIEVSDTESANDHLRSGWRLLSVRTEQLADVAQQTVYVLGRPRASRERQNLRMEEQEPRFEVKQLELQRAPQPLRPEGARDSIRHRSTPTPQSSAPSPDPPPRPITLVTRIALPETPTTKRRRRKQGDEPASQPRELTEAELQEQEGWKQVAASGKPVLVADKLLIPGEMSPWDAIEYLPDGLREQTRAAMQHKLAGAVQGLIESMRERLSTELGDEAQRENYRKAPYPLQMAMAETLVRPQLGWKELPMKDLVRQYGAVIEEKPGED